MCKHKYKAKNYLFEWNPMGIKKCDKCGFTIHLSWPCRILYILTCFVGPIALLLPLIINDYYLRFGYYAFVIFLITYTVQLLLQITIMKHGKYVLVNNPSNDDNPEV